MVHALGSNDDYQSGINYDNDTNNKVIKSPIIIKSLDNVNIICCGLTHNLCLTSTKIVLAFGSNTWENPVFQVMIIWSISTNHEYIF